MSSTDVNGRRLRLVQQLLDLPEARLAEVEQLLKAVPTSPAVPVERDWPYAPMHRLCEH